MPHQFVDLQCHSRSASHTVLVFDDVAEKQAEDNIVTGRSFCFFYLICGRGRTLPSSVLQREDVEGNGQHSKRLPLLPHAALGRYSVNLLFIMSSDFPREAATSKLHPVHGELSWLFTWPL